MTPRTPMASCGDAGGLTNAGTPCRSPFSLSPVNGRCISHDPERVDEARAVRAAGGRASHHRDREEPAPQPAPLDVPPRMQTLDDAVNMASWITHSVLSGKIDARTAESATKACRQFQLGEEKATLLRRISELEAELREMTGTSGASRVRSRRGPLEVA